VAGKPAGHEECYRYDDCQVVVRIKCVLCIGELIRLMPPKGNFHNLGQESDSESDCRLFLVEKGWDFS
jgi:hypothetical protein